MFYLGRFAPSAGLFLTAAVLTSAAPRIDLTRTEPVPVDQPIPIQDFFRVPTMRQPKLNPAGTHIAAVVEDENDAYALLAYNLKTQETQTLGAWGGREITDFRWLTNNRLVMQVATDTFGGGLIAANLGQFHSAYPLNQYSNSVIVAIPPKNGAYPLVWLRRDLQTGKDRGVAKLDSSIETGKILDTAGRVLDIYATDADLNFIAKIQDWNEKEITEQHPAAPGESGVTYFADKEGNLELGISATHDDYSAFLWKNHGWQKTPLNANAVEIVGSGDKFGELAVVTSQDAGKPTALCLMDADSGKVSQVLLQDTAYDPNGYIYRKPDTGDILGYVYDRNGPTVAWFYEEYKALQKVLEGFFPGLVVRVLGSDEATKILLVATYSDRQPPIYYSVNLESKSVAVIRRTRPWIDPKRMQPTNIIKFKTRDGHHLDAYLTLPTGATKANPPPLIVLPHAGPWGLRDTWGFDGEVQFLVSRGYAVLQPNYRSSGGYLWMFSENDNWDFAKMSDDVTDAVHAVLTTGYVDKSRVGIVGTSFGGCLAIAGATREGDLYKCAVSIAGTFAWPTTKSEAYAQFDDYRYGMLMKRLGDPAKHRGGFEDVSPLRHVDQVKIPVFVAIEKDGSPADVSQSQRLVSELDRSHVPHDSVTVGGDGRGLHSVANEVEVYSRIESFLATNLPAKSK